MRTQARVRTATLVGVEAVPVDVEVDIGAGLPSFSIVGLADTAVLEARERVRSAIRASGFELPNARIIINLAPGPLRKHGTGFDLPIALGLLTATGQLPQRVTEAALVVGELSLDGTLREIPGVIAYAIAARRLGIRLIGPASCARAVGIGDVHYAAISRLSQLRAGLPEDMPSIVVSQPTPTDTSLDFSDVVAQETAVRALVIAAAGGHNVLMVGPPGSGKTMLARRLPTILPALTAEERVSTALVHSVGGLDPAPALSGTRPFRAPHHSASIAGLVGGGSPPRPGEISLAHNGVLFLDEMPEFSPSAMQCLRQPLEDKCVTLVRAEGRISFPAGFALIGAANPCPCGFLGDSKRPCTCTPAHVDRYRNRIGGPLMDRVDIVVHVDRPAPSLLVGGSRSATSSSLMEAVLQAREQRTLRGVELGLSGASLLSDCALDSSARASAEKAAMRHHLSGRGITRLLRVARTIADTEGRRVVSSDHIHEAIGYRAVDRP